MTSFALAFCLCILGFFALAAFTETLFAALFGEDMK